jgi:hypothetical protein
MPNQPLISATVRIMTDDINGNNTTKQFNTVYGLNFDYNKGMVNIIDATGSFYFSLFDVITLTYTVAGGVDGGAVTVVMS